MNGYLPGLSSDIWHPAHRCDAMLDEGFGASDGLNLVEIGVGLAYPFDGPVEFEVFSWHGRRGSSDRERSGISSKVYFTISKLLKPRD